MSTLVQTVFNVPTVSGQVAGTNTITLTATLSAASPETVAYMEEAKNYINTIENNIGDVYTNLQLFQAAISSTAETFNDADGNPRYTWSAMEAFANGSDFTKLKADRDLTFSQLMAVNNTLLTHDQRIEATEDSNQAQNVLLDRFRDDIGDVQSKLTLVEMTSNDNMDELDTLLLASDQHQAQLSVLESVTQAHSPRLDAIDTTNAVQNVLIDALQTQERDHEERIVIVESNTDIVAQNARFEAIEDTTALHTTQLDTVVTTIANNATATTTAIQTVASELQSVENDLLTHAASNTAALNQEIFDRTTGDTAVLSALETVITTKEQERIAADVALQTSLEATITAEEEARIAADDGLSFDIATKVSLAGDESIAGNKTFTGDVIVEGTAILNDAVIKTSGELDVGDAVVTLNAGETGVPSVNAGFEIQRGTFLNAQLLWQESTDEFVAGKVGDLQPIVLDNDPRFSNTMNLTGNQTVAGTKTFDNTTRFKSSVLTDGIGGDVDPFIFVTTPLRYSAGAVTSIVNHNELITKGYVDDEVATKLDRTGGVIDGLLEIKNPTAQTQFRDANNILKGQIFTNDTTFVFLRRNDGVQGAKLTLTDTAATFSTETRGVATTSGSNSLAFTTKNYVDGNFVDVNTTQDIAGEKRFTDVVKFNTFTPNGNGNTFTNAPIQYSNTLNVNNSAAVNSAQLITKGYVDATKLDKSGGTITGDVTINKPSAALVINSDINTHAQIAFKEDGENKGFIYHDHTNDIFRIQRRNGTATTNELQLRDDMAILSDDLRITNPGINGSSVLTITGGNDRYFSKTGGTITGDIVLNDLNVNSNPAMYFRRSGIENARIQGVGNRLLIEHTSGTTPSSIQLFADSVETNVNAAINTPDNPALLLKENDSNKTYLGWVNGRTILRQYTSSGHNELNLFDGFTVSSKPIRIADTPVNANDLTNKTYVDDQLDTKLNKTGGTLTGQLSVISPAAYVLAQSTTDATAQFRLSNNGKLVMQMYCISHNAGANDRLSLVKIDNTSVGGGQSNSLAIYSDHVRMSRDTVEGNPRSAITSKGYVDDKFNFVLEATPTAASGGRLRLREGSNNGTAYVDVKAPDNVINSYTMIMPEVSPTPGQQLQVASVSGTMVTMEWV